MLEQLNSLDYAVYTVQPRKPTDDPYKKAKEHKDRFKLKRWITALLSDRDVILFYKDNGEEKMVVATTRTPEVEGYFPPLATEKDFPIFTEVVAHAEVSETRHIAFYQMPLRLPTTIHLDDIVKFIVTSHGLGELTHKVLTNGQG